jgi:transcriptional regulator with XRE-family HTH domain
MPKTIHRPEYDVLRAMVRSLRDGAGITQVEMSARLGRSQSFVSDIERGVRRLDILELRDICELAGRDFAGFARELDVAVAKFSSGTNAAQRTSARSARKPSRKA